MDMVNAWAITTVMVEFKPVQQDAMGIVFLHPSGSVQASCPLLVWDCRHEQ